MAINVHYKAKNVPRPCESWPVPCFVILQNSKHGQLQYFWMYRKYCILIDSKKLRNTHSDSKFNQKFDYEFGMQGLTMDLLQIYCDIVVQKRLVLT